MTDKILSTIGERIKSARMQLGYTRKEFEEKFGIPSATLQAWECGKYDIPIKGVIRFIEALYKAGLATTKDWFINAEGSPPRLIESINYPNNFVKEAGLSEDEIILREVTFFEEINQNPMIAVISDDTMEPIFGVGDYVGGNAVSGEYASRYIGTLCILTLDTGEIFVRKLKYGTITGSYNLVSLNLDSNSRQAFILDCKIINLAQIVWHRKIEHIRKEKVYT